MTCLSTEYGKYTSLVFQKMHLTQVQLIVNGTIHYFKKGCFEQRAIWEIEGVAKFVRSPKVAYLGKFCYQAWKIRYWSVGISKKCFGICWAVLPELHAYWQLYRYKVVKYCSFLWVSTCLTMIEDWQNIIKHFMTL